jgi:hypothetical protein
MYANHVGENVTLDEKKIDTKRHVVVVCQGGRGQRVHAAKVGRNAVLRPRWRSFGVAMSGPWDESGPVGRQSGVTGQFRMEPIGQDALVFGLARPSERARYSRRAALSALSASRLVKSRFCASTVEIIV